MENIYRSVHIPVQHKPTLRTVVRALGQIFCNQFAAARTHFGRVARIHQQDSSASFFRFTDCQADELRPRNIHYAFSHASAFAHLHRCQFFKYDYLMDVHQRPRLLVGEIATAVGDLLVNTRQNTLLFGVFGPVLRVFWPRPFAVAPVSSRPHHAGRSAGWQSVHHSRA